MAIDLTERIERLEVFEERLGVTLDSLSAFVEDHGEDNIFLSVRGELQAKDGTQLSEDVELVVAAYDLSGWIIGTSSATFSADEFYGLETFDITIGLPLNQVSKVRVYPKKA